MRERVLRKVGKTLREKIGKFVFANTVIFATVAANESPEPVELETQYDNQDYKITVTPVGHQGEGGEKEETNFYNKFFNVVQAKLKLIPIGRKFFDPTGAVDLPQHKLTLWPGFGTAIGDHDSGCLLQIDVSHRCLRTNTVLDMLSGMMNQQDFRQKATKLLVGGTVLTLYNKKVYNIDDIDFNSTPMNEFNDHTGTAMTYVQYYERRWNKQITNTQQPLLVCKLKKIACHLIPEFCVLTGLTDEIRADFNIMKDMANATKKEPAQRLDSCRALIRSIEGNAEAKGEMDTWKAGIDQNAVELKGSVMNPGTIGLGGGKSFGINPSTCSFDRECQATMHSQPPLNCWGVFYCQMDQRIIDNFLNTFRQASSTFGLQCGQPRPFPIPSARWGDWDQCLRANLNPNVQIIVCAIPGSKNKSPLYDDLKRLTICDFPVPTQCVLTQTLKKERGLRSVVNKLIVQMNSKVSGTPWVVSDIPLRDIPTMVLGIDMFAKRGASTVFGFSGTVDPYFAKYTSFPITKEEGAETGPVFAQAIQELVAAYAKDNNTAPQRIIVFRDGVSESQIDAVLATEVTPMKEALTKMQEEGKVQQVPKICYIIVNKRVNARFFSKQGPNIQNPPLGTVIDSSVTSKDGYDFYLLPAKANQGAMTPTYFTVVFDDSGCKSDDVQALAFKLSFTYFNWSGSVRVPAPCLYAHRLAYLLGERAQAGQAPVPHQHWKNTRSLYYI